MTKPAAICAFLLLAAASSARAEKLDDWTVIGLRAGEEATSLRDEVADLRGALLLELSARGSGKVLDEESTRMRLGLAGDLRQAREALEAAELYYFQLELGAARSKLERAIAALEHASGIPDAWETTRNARMLLAMVHLAGDRPESSDAARLQLEAIARVDPEWTPSVAAWPEEILALYAEGRANLAASGSGRLHVRCASDCAGGTVFVDTHPLGEVDAPIDLPAGSYRVVLADRFERPDRTSLVREVEIAAARDTELTIDLDEEGRLRVEEGPIVVAEKKERGAASLAARRASTDFTLVLLGADAGARRAWLLDADGVTRATIEVDAAAALPLRELARRAIESAAAGTTPDGEGAALVAAPEVGGSDDAAVAPAATAAAPPPIVWKAAQWGTAGCALVAAALGAGLHVDAADRDAALRSRIGDWQGVVPSARTARVARSEADAIAAQANWGTGLLVGAGALAVTSVTLFLLEPGEPAPTVRW